VHVNNAPAFARSGREIRVDPMEGALARSVFVALTRRRVQRVWRGVVLNIRGVFI
jgi:peroxiredoxin